jgi:hypothetical protein
MALHNLDDKLWFGKYKGAEFQWIMKNDPGYISWCIKSGALKQNELPTEVGEVNDQYELDREEVEDNIANFWGTESLPFSTSVRVTDQE